MSAVGRNLKYGALVGALGNWGGPVAQVGRPIGAADGPTKSIWLLTRWSGVRTGGARVGVALRTSPRARSVSMVHA